MDTRDAWRSQARYTVFDSEQGGTGQGHRAAGKHAHLLLRHATSATAGGACEHAISVRSYRRIGV